MDGSEQAPEDELPPPDYERVEWATDSGAEPMLFRRVIRSGDE
jgi:hypothetical protein